MKDRSCSAELGEGGREGWKFGISPRGGASALPAESPTIRNYEPMIHIPLLGKIANSMHFLVITNTVNGLSLGSVIISFFLIANIVDSDLFVVVLHSSNI